jgi:hypothetical protein
MFCHPIGNLAWILRTWFILRRERQVRTVPQADPTYCPKRAAP